MKRTQNQSNISVELAVAIFLVVINYLIHCINLYSAAVQTLTPRHQLSRRNTFAGALYSASHLIADVPSYLLVSQPFNPYSFDLKASLQKCHKQICIVFILIYLHLY
jgi:hypothetical protein